MFGSVVLDVAIGMAFVYLLLSLIASVIQELLATFMQLRAANLEKGLHSLFSGDSISSEMDLVNSIYDHGLVRGLYSDPKKDGGKLPSLAQLSRTLIPSAFKAGIYWRTRNLALGTLRPPVYAATLSARGWSGIGNLPLNWRRLG